jgi:orotidine-5'-phosphate decarboxylase
MAVAARAEATLPLPIIALDVATSEEALGLVERLPRASFFKVGLQLYTAEGPTVVRRLKDRGLRVFLDLKLHDIPNTVAGAVRSAAGLGVDILTLHASGGAAMMAAAVDAATARSQSPMIFAVTVLTSLDSRQLGAAWGRPAPSIDEEVARLAHLADREGCDGVVASVREAESIRSATRPDLAILSPGIRLPGDDAGDQARVATPAEAARAFVDYIVIGRAVTAAPDPAAAYERVLADLSVGAAASG